MTFELSSRYVHCFRDEENRPVCRYRLFHGNIWRKYLCSVCTQTKAGIDDSKWSDFFFLHLLINIELFISLTLEQHGFLSHNYSSLLDRSSSSMLWTKRELVCTKDCEKGPDDRVCIWIRQVTRIHALVQLNCTYSCRLVTFLIRVSMHKMSHLKPHEQIMLTVKKILQNLCKPCRYMVQWGNKWNAMTRK